jgi:hypothetical protein
MKQKRWNRRFRDVARAALEGSAIYVMRISRRK